MKSHYVLIVLCIICLITAFSAGCTSQSKPATPAATPAPVSTSAAAPAGTQVAKTQVPVTIATAANGYYTLTESENKGSYLVSKNDLLYVDLDENPSTGYLWNMTVSPGLTIVKDDYIAPTTGQGVGASGTHEWEIKATGIGDQKISAILARPTAPTTGTETSYLAYIIIGS
nr:protease inhibitor I42 family protein [uncultured Methanoregula sp.]